MRDAADAEAYIARLAALPATLDGETGRVRTAREARLVAPTILLDRTIVQLGKTIADALGGGRLVAALTSRTAAIPGECDRRARVIVAGPIAAALDRQLAEIRAERAVAQEAPGM